MTRHKRLGIIMALVLSVALALLTSCVRSVDGTALPNSSPKSGDVLYCFDIQNKSFENVRIAVGRVNQDFFFAEEFEPGQRIRVCHEDIGVGRFIFCWMGMKDLGLDCMHFYVTSDDIPKLLDDELDLWVEPADTRGCLNEWKESQGT